MKKPVIASIMASSQIFRFYSDGVIDNNELCLLVEIKKNKIIYQKQPNHAVLVVGYGKSINQINGIMQEYFIIKNSFGKNWGENGYVKISTSTLSGPSGVCGILT